MFRALILAVGILIGVTALSSAAAAQYYRCNPYYSWGCGYHPYQYHYWGYHPWHGYWHRHW